LKITDFGLSTLRKTRYDKKSLNALNKTSAGSEFYRAPELDSLKGGYDNKVDIYSMGIILMECLANFQNDKNAKENALQRMQENCHLSDDIKRNLLLEIFRQSQVNNVSNYEVDLILHMTNPNPANRPTALQANNKILCIYSSKNLNSKYGLHLDEDILCKLNGMFLTTISTSQSPIRSLNEDNYDKPENTLKLETLIKQDEFKIVVKRDYFNSESDVHKIIIFKAEDEDIEKARDKRRNDYAKVANELANMKIMSVKHVNILEFMRKLDQSQLVITVVMPICIKSLADLLKETKNVRIRDFSVGCKLFKDILYGIWYLHRLKYIHHNLKPSNILLGSDSKWKISDYGLQSLKATNGFESEVEYYLCQITSGEPCYAAPEQLEQIDESEMETSIKVKQDSEFKIDIFSFACVCIEYLTHFDDETNISLAAALNSIRDEHVLPDDLLHGEFAELFPTFYDCTHKKASKRPDSLQVISVLHEFFELKNPSLYQEILNE
jgi:serine/threonine protein kinase